MTAPVRAALLVDADNVTGRDVERAVAHLADTGLLLTIRRAYGGHEKLAGMKDCLLRHGLRAQVNQGKGTTDALLVVEAMDLLHAGQLPPVVAIASSDGDFAPLALRLREAGLKVLCFAMAGKSAEEGLLRAYDEVHYLDEASPKPPAPKPPAPKPPAATKPTPPPAPRKRAAKKAPLAPTPPLFPPDPLHELLVDMPGFLEEESIELGEVVKRLRDEKLLGKSASGVTYLRQNAPYVTLHPAKNPNKLRYVPSQDPFNSDDDIPF